MKTNVFNELRKKTLLIRQEYFEVVLKKNGRIAVKEKKRVVALYVSYINYIIGGCNNTAAAFSLEQTYSL